MKSLTSFCISFTLYLLIAGNFLSGQQPWRRINPLPVENNLLCVSLIPQTNTVVIAGDNATLLTTQENGETWQIWLNPGNISDNVNLVSVCFTSQNTGFMVSADGKVLKTTTGLNGWEVAHQLPFSNINNAKVIYFRDASCGFVLGGNGTLFRTENAGETWEMVDVGTTAGLGDISFCSDSTGFIVGGFGSHILKTEDGGLTWNMVDFPLTNPDSYTEDIEFVNESIGFIIGFEYSSGNIDGKIFKTIDACETWEEVYSDGSMWSGKLSFFDENHLIVAYDTWPYAVKVLVTENGGQNWQSVELPGNSLYAGQSVKCCDDNQAMIAGLRGKIYHTSDYGASWQAMFSSLNVTDIYDVQFLSPSKGFALVNDLQSTMQDFLFQTDDGGESWTRLFITPDFTFGGGLDFIDNMNGFYLGQGYEPRFYKTTDGGTIWEFCSTFPYEIDGISCLRFFDTSCGLVSAEYDGVIYKTSDGGSTWTNVFSNSYEVFDIEYLDENRVLAAGKFLYLSNDAGNTWEAMDIGNTHTLFDIFILDENTGWISGSDDLLFKTTNGGFTWEILPINSSIGVFNKVWFTDEMNGYLMSEWLSYLFKTTDGGQTWQPTEKPSTSTLTDLYFFDENNGLIFGANGLIAKTETGGLVGFPESENLVVNHFTEIFPNPCQNNLNIMFNEKMNTGITLTVKNLKPETLLQKQIPAMHGLNYINLNTTSLSPGTYFLTVSAGKSIDVQKFVKLE